ncbi:MAG: SDR family oxidoreductase [Sulfitobacter sp.]|nr:SDR family oxidoreductase [Sulfitobacter sp.]
MNVLVAGATGKTGQLLVRELLHKGAKPTALVRDISDTSTLPDGCDLRKGDLTDLPQDVCAGMDAVIFAAGSGGDTDAEMTDKVDRDGAKALVDRAKAEGVQRFVMLSSVGADNPPEDHDLAHYLQAKHAADRHLMDSGLTYAVLRPVALTDDGKSPNILFGDAVDQSATAARADVAEVLADAALMGTMDGTALDMQSGKAKATA